MPSIADILNRSNVFRQKPAEIQQLVLDTASILEQMGIPVHTTPRRLERMVLVFLAVSNIRRNEDWPEISDRSSSHSLTTREIISYLNDEFKESISFGSYDDIRRKDLKFIVEAGIIVQTQTNVARNNPTRSYRLNPALYLLLETYGTPQWEKGIREYHDKNTLLREELAGVREIERIKIKIPDGRILNFDTGKHNQLQKAIIEEFLPRYGYGAELLYVGDASDKYLLLEENKLRALNFFEIKHGELPDVIAYSASRNWLYLIEAVHSSGAIDAIRHRKLLQLTTECKASLIFVTAFLDRATFRRFVIDIAWETEVWIAESPDHLIHFNGDKFLGPY